MFIDHYQLAGHHVMLGNLMVRLCQYPIDLPSVHYMQYLT